MILCTEGNITIKFAMVWQIKELEDELRVQEQKQQYANDCTDSVRATPIEGKTFIRHEYISEVEVEPHILRSSNSVNGRMSQGSILLKGNLHETRKRDYRNADTENNVFSSSLHEPKISRKSDPPKIARVMRTKLVTAAQGPSTLKRTSRDQVQGIKERDNKKKIWSR